MRQTGYTARDDRVAIVMRHVYDGSYYHWQTTNFHEVELSIDCTANDERNRTDRDGKVFAYSIHCASKASDLATRNSQLAGLG
jgi:hypothetical protein